MPTLEEKREWSGRSQYKSLRDWNLRPAVLFHVRLCDGFSSIFSGGTIIRHYISWQSHSLILDFFFSPTSSQPWSIQPHSQQSRCWPMFGAALRGFSAGSLGKRPWRTFTCDTTHGAAKTSLIYVQTSTGVGYRYVNEIEEKCCISFLKSRKVRLAGLQKGHTDFPRICSHGMS